jgi:hypothetical protein
MLSTSAPEEEDAYRNTIARSSGLWSGVHIVLVNDDAVFRDACE